MGRLGAAEVVDVVYALVVIGGAKNVRNGFCSALAGESGGPETEGEESETNYASGKQGDGNLSDQQEFDGRRALSPSCKGNLPGPWQ